MEANINNNVDFFQGKESLNPTQVVKTSKTETQPDFLNPTKVIFN